MILWLARIVTDVINFVIKKCKLCSIFAQYLHLNYKHCYVLFPTIKQRVAFHWKQLLVNCACCLHIFQSK